ncbi:hypothetical protein [Trueperella pyogenes]|uniref:hypothetical protein n=1 Tax=Trueperella pyogenes TaxID=1661 RepID=UPI00345D4792
MDIPTWISAGAALVSIAGSAFAWWRSNLSKRAKEDAAQAASIAARKVEIADEQSAHMRAQAEELRALNDSLQALVRTVAAKPGATLSDLLELFSHAASTTSPAPHIERGTGSMFVLVNPRSNPFVVEHVRNREQFSRLDLEDSFTIPPRGQKSFLALEAWGHPVPDHLVVDEAGLDEPTYLRFPPKES